MNKEILRRVEALENEVTPKHMSQDEVIAWVNERLNELEPMPAESRPCYERELKDLRHLDALRRRLVDIVVEVCLPHRKA